MRRRARGEREKESEKCEKINLSGAIQKLQIARNGKTVCKHFALPHRSCLHQVRIFVSSLGSRDGICSRQRADMRLSQHTSRKTWRKLKNARYADFDVLWLRSWLRTWLRSWLPARHRRRAGTFWAIFRPRTASVHLSVHFILQRHDSC